MLLRMGYPKNLLWAAAKLADWALPLGLEAVPEVLLHPSAAERFTRCAPGLSPVARRTLRTNLRFIGRRVVPQLYPADALLPRERAKKPYSPAQISGFLALADAQPAAGRRMRAAALVCLGAGAGLIRSDLRDVRGGDVACRSGGVVVTVRGARPRAVPVLARYHVRLLAAARFAGNSLICGGTDPGRRNLTNPLIIALDGGGGLPRLDTSRLRATWLAEVAQLELVRQAAQCPRALVFAIWERRAALAEQPRRPVRVEVGKLAVSDRFRQRPRDDVAEPAPEGVVALLARECLTPGVQRQREDRPRRRAVLDHVLNLPGKAVPSPAMAAWLGLTYRCRVVSRLWPLMAMSRER